MKGLLVCVYLLVLFNFDLSVSSCEDGQSVKDKMENYFVKGLCGSKNNAAMFFARDADVSWDGVQVFCSNTVLQALPIGESLSF